MVDAAAIRQKLNRDTDLPRRLASAALAMSGCRGRRPLHAGRHESLKRSAIRSGNFRGGGIGMHAAFTMHSCHVACQDGTAAAPGKGWRVSDVVDHVGIRLSDLPTSRRMYESA